MRDSTETEMSRIERLYLIRHGLTEANSQRRYLGRTNMPLSAEGVEKAKSLREKGVYPKPDILLSGPMKRCMQTAGILFPDMKIRCVEKWYEIDFGDFEGKTADELMQDARYRAFIDAGGTLPFPNGESREAFSMRCLAGFYEIPGIIRETPAKAKGPLQKQGQNELTLAAVVHGGTIMALLEKLAGGNYFDYQIRPGEGYCCRPVITDENVLKLSIEGKISV